MKIRSNLVVLAISILFGIMAIVGLLWPSATTVRAAQIKAADYSVKYIVNNYWRHHAAVIVFIRNKSASTISDWKLCWTFPNKQKITRIWNGVYTQDGSAVTVKNRFYNARIPAGHSVCFGFNLRYRGHNHKPPEFTLTGDTDATNSSPTNTPTVTATPTPTASTSPAANTFYTSSVDDGLDANDRVLFETYFKEMGYTLSGNNNDIASAQLNTLLGRTDIGLIYHSGHGIDGGIQTSDSILYVSDVSEVSIPTAIFATCLTLTSTDWKSKMNASCNQILGYTDESYDYIDDTIVENFAGQIKSGNSMIQAWYNANTALSYVSDRWCGYVREDDGIVEYSARAGNTPKTTGAEMKALDAKGAFQVAVNLMADTSTYDSYFWKIRNSEIKVTGGKTQDAKFYRKAPAFLAKKAMDRDQAVTIAQNWVSGSLPFDAQQDAVTEIVVTDTSGSSKVVGQVIRYSRYLDGLPLRTNGAEDHLAVLVNDDGVAASSKLWPTLETKSKPGAIPYSEMLSLSAAIQKAAPKIAQMIKADQSVVITAANPCYGRTKQGKIVPAYELIDATGGRIIINAMTADLVF
ncbi:MAG: cellulose binding domain-containing protein [Bacillota bacterium]